MKFPIIHTRYNEISEKDFDKHPAQLRHQVNWSREALEAPETLNERKIGTLSGLERSTLDSMVDLSQRYGFRLIFWVAPYRLTAEVAKKYNAVEEYAVNHGITYLGYREMTEGSGFDFGTDMRRESSRGSHMNNSGSEKTTHYIGGILSGEYGLTDKRGDPAYAEYDGPSREWQLILATHHMDNDKNLADYASRIDPELFDATVMFMDEDSELRAKDTLKEILASGTGTSGLYTDARQNGINRAWELSDRVKLVLAGNVVRRAVLYDGTSPVDLHACNICVIIVDKLTGKLINLAEFELTDDGYLKI